MDWLQDILSYSFFRHALLAGLIIGFTNGCFGSIVVLRKSALIASALSHTLLPGIAVGIFFAGGMDPWAMFIGAVFAALFVVLASLAVARSSRLDQGAALAVIYTAAFAFGVFVWDHLPTKMKLEDVLFGDILNVHRQDLWVALGAAAVVLVTVAACWRPILLTLFEPSVAAAQGVPVRALNYLIMTLLAIVMVSSLQAVGCTLSLGLMIAPAAAISLFTNSARAMFWGGGLLGAVCSVSGILGGHATNTRPGVAITILLGAVFLLAYVFSPKSGLLRRKPVVDQAREK